MSLTIIETNSPFILRTMFTFWQAFSHVLQEPHVFSGILSSSLENIKLAVIFLGVNFYCYGFKTESNKNKNSISS